jgi:hypothetical protein
VPIGHETGGHFLGAHAKVLETMWTRRLRELACSLRQQKADESHETSSPENACTKVFLDIPAPFQTHCAKGL